MFKMFFKKEGLIRESETIMEIYVINSNIAIIFLWYGIHVFCVNESRLFIFDVGNSRQKRQAWHRGH